MRKFWQKHKRDILILALFIIIWRLSLYFVSVIAPNFIEVRTRFFGPIPWANLDGNHYLLIAEYGYSLFQQAFFPLFPLLIKFIYNITPLSYLHSSLLLVYGATIFSTIILYNLAKLQKITRQQSLWVVVYFLSFPTAFYLFSVYTESLFLLLIVITFFLLQRKRYFEASIIAGFASATRVIGIFLLPAILYEFYKTNRKSKNFTLKIIGLSIVSSLGLFLYMVYLWKFHGDPLLFAHVQPAFGAGRSGGEIILLPQVLWRYFKIFITVPMIQLEWWVAFLEVGAFFSALFSIILAYKKKVAKSMVIFSTFALILPTVTGTLTSVPRYTLVCIATYFAWALVENKWVRLSVLIFSIILQGILVAFFLRGYFVS